MTKVFVSAVIESPVEKVWEKIRDFNALPDWHPVIERSRIEDDRSGDSVGCIRNFYLTNGGNIREKLLALSDPETLCTYSILEAPLPVTNYVSTLRLRKVTEGDGTYAEWQAEFDALADEEAGAIETVRGVFASGLESLQGMFHS